MRELLALLVSAMAIAVLTALAIVFARTSNPPAEPGTAKADVIEVGDSAPEASVDSVRGRLVFDSRSCSRCHSVDGAGSQRSPLDGVGSRRTPAELRAWTLATGDVADSLPPAVRSVKQEYGNLPPEELNALVVYLGRLHEVP